MALATCPFLPLNNPLLHEELCTLKATWLLTSRIQSFRQQTFIKKLLCVKHRALVQECQDEEQTPAAGQQYMEDRHRSDCRGQTQLRRLQDRGGLETKGQAMLSEDTEKWGSRE